MKLNSHSLSQRLVLALLALLVAGLVLRQSMSERHTGDFDIGGFAALPVQEGGRIKPADTVARTALLLIASRTSYVNEDNERIGAAEWFTELSMNPAQAAERRVFRIDHPEVAGILGINHEERQYVSLSEILPHFDALRTQWAGVPDEASQRSAYDTALVKLRDAIRTYDGLTYVYISPPVFGRMDHGHRMLKRILNDNQTLDSESEEARIVQNALTLFRTQFERIQHSAGMATIPPADAVPDLPETLIEWKDVGGSLLAAIDSGSVDPVATLYSEMAEAYQTGHVDGFNTRVEQVASLIAERGHAPMGKVTFETFLNHLSPYTLAEAIYILVFVVAALSWIIWPQTLASAAFWLMFSAFILHTFGLVGRTYIQGRPPITNLYSSAIFVGWAAVLLCLFLERRFRNGLAAAAAAPIGFCTLIIAYHLSQAPGDTMEVMRAVLDSNFWLATHVPTVTLGYSASFLAGSLALVYILRDRLFGGLDRDGARALEGMVYAIVCFALLFSFVGTVLGGIWADQSWGRFWGWDPKENGALMIVLWNALILHARWAKLTSPTGIMQLAIVGNIITAWSWFGTNLLGVGLHAYGFTDSGFYWLVAFSVSQLVIIIIGWAPRLFTTQSARPITHR